MTVDPNRIRCIDPLVTPQYPFDEAPKPPERSEPGTVYELAIEIWTVSNVFKPGHRLRMEISNHDSVITANGRPHVTIRNRATNTIYEGGGKASRLVVPVILR